MSRCFTSDQPVGVGIRQRAQQHGLDHGEERGVGADAEREREHDGGREAGLASEDAQGVSQIAQDHGVPFLSGR